MADAAGDEPDEHLARLGLGQVDLLHDERLPEVLEDGGADLHLAPSGGMRRRIISGGDGRPHLVRKGEAPSVDTSP